MRVTWIYAFADSGYENGVKVGRSSTAFGAWDDAPCYSPRPLLYLASWKVDIPAAPGVARGVAASAVERSVHAVLGESLTFPRNGREWFDITSSDALERLSNALRSAPSVVDGHRGRRVTNDQFRNPHPTKLSRHPLKIVAWVYREHLTGRLKTQVIDDWTTPFEVRRRYSRNGFEEIAAFAYEGEPSSEGNAQVYAAWLITMKMFGAGTDDTVYGWLPAGVAVEDITVSYLRAGLGQLQIDRRCCATGVRASYNRSQ